MKLSEPQHNINGTWTVVVTEDSGETRAAFTNRTLTAARREAREYVARLRDRTRTAVAS
jgi:hypothetical protein